MRASSRFRREAGMRTSWRWACRPLRTRVRKSATGSVMLMEISVCSLSPARLGHAGYEAFVRELAQADAAEAELAVHGASPAATAAAGIDPRLVFGSPPLTDALGSFGH